MTGRGRVGKHGRKLFGEYRHERPRQKEKKKRNFAHLFRENSKKNKNGGEKKTDMMDHVCNGLYQLWYKCPPGLYATRSVSRRYVEDARTVTQGESMRRAYPNQVVPPECVMPTRGCVVFFRTFVVNKKPLLSMVVYGLCNL